jgi:hypothetical protein
MKVLSVRQPWAFAIFNCGKDVENRNWPTNFRGRLAIHAGKKFDMNKSDWEDFLSGQYFSPYTEMAEKWQEHRSRSIPLDDPDFGAIIGTVEVYDCVPDICCHSPWKADGQEFYCWVLRDPILLSEPIPMNGRLGLFDVPDSLFSPRERGISPRFVKRP